MKIIKVKQIGKSTGTLGWLAEQSISFKYHLCQENGEIARVFINDEYALEAASDEDNQESIDNFDRYTGHFYRFDLTAAARNLLETSAREWLKEHLAEIATKEEKQALNFKIVAA